MLYTSEKTGKSYKTIEELEIAEQEFDKAHAAEIALKEEKKAALDNIHAKEAELAKLYDAVVAKQREIEIAKSEFANKYNNGCWHSTKVVKDGKTYRIENPVADPFGVLFSVLGSFIDQDF